MGISPWAKGQTSPTWTIEMIRDNNTVMDITGVATNQLSLAIYNVQRTQIGTGAGTFTIVQANSGIVQYKPNASDSSIIGNNSVRVIVDFNGTDNDMSDYIPWQVNP